MAMVVTNQTAQDYWFGPLHLAAGVGQTLSVDDTTATSLYLKDDTVADALNILYASGKITVSGAAFPFPRPTGTPAVLNGDGSPEGLVYAAQGSVYFRRDKSGIYQKTTGIHLNTGWVAVADSALKPSAATFESIPRQSADGNIAALTSAQLTLFAIYLPAAAVVASITAVSGATALATGLNQWFALYDGSLNKLAVSSDDTSTAWAANTAKTLALAAPFVTTYSGLYYLGVMVKATTPPTLVGTAAQAGVVGLTPKLAGTSTSGLTNPASAPSVAAALTTLGAALYGYVS
jgi:hypothetical protein